MSIRSARREAAIDKMADHLLREGMAGASLRGLAGAAGASDRMLLYYFADQALPQGARLSPDDLFQALWSSAGAPSLQPFMHLWLELAAAAARHREPQRSIAGLIARQFAGWIEGHTAGETGLERTRSSARLFATLEGLLLLSAVGCGDIAQVAAEAAMSQPRA